MPSSPTLSGKQIFLCFAALLLLNLNHKLFVLFTPFLAHRWGIPLSEYPLSLLAVHVSSTVTSLLGMLLDVSPKGVMVIAQVALATITAVLSLCTSMPVVAFCLLRLVFGACRSPLMSAVIAAVGIWVPEAHRGWAISWIETSYWLSDMLMPMGGAALESGNAEVNQLLAVLALSHLVMGLATWLAFPAGKGKPRDEVIQNCGDAYQKMNESDATAAPAELKLLQMFASLMSPRPLSCLAWALLAHVVYYSFLTSVGVWWHEQFGLDSATTGYCGILIGMGNFCGFLLNLACTDRLGSSKAVIYATCAMVLAYFLLGMVSVFMVSSLFFALLTSFIIFAFSEFGFLACIAWVTVACPEERGVSQLTMSLAFRCAAGIGSGIGTVIALPLYQSASISLNALVAVVLYLLFLVMSCWRC